MFLPARGSKAFTLLELIVVIVILGILAAIAIPTFQKVIEKSKDNSAKQTLQALDREAQALAAFDQVPADETHYAAAAEDLNAFQTGLLAAGTYTVATTETEAAAGSKLGLKVAEGTVGVSLLSESGNCVTLRNAAGTVTLDVKKIAAAECSGATAWLETGTVAAPAAEPASGPLVLAGTVTRYAGTGTAGGADGAGVAASFNNPSELVAAGEHLYTVDHMGHKIRRIVVATGEVTTFAGSPTGAYGSADGIGTAATFNSPWGITTDGTNLYVTDGAHTIRKISIATQQVTTLAGLAGKMGYDNSTDGTGGTARFYSPTGITHLAGKLYVADRGAGKVRHVDAATGNTTTLAPGINSVRGVAVAADGTKLYATSDTLLYRIDLANPAAAEAFGNDSSLPHNNAYQIAVDGNNLYVADLSNHKIKKVDLTTGAVSLVAGSGTAGTVDGTGAGASFNLPGGVAVHSTGLYVSEHLGHVIRKIV